MKRHKRNAGLNIDLTSILDVIFIVLMVVMCNRSVNENKEIESLKKENDQLNAEKAVLEDQLYTYEHEDDLVSYVVLYANYETNNPQNRNIWLSLGDEEVIPPIPITPETEEEKYTQIKDELENYVSERSDKPVLIVLDESQILHRDRKRLDEMLSVLDDNPDYPNLYKRKIKE